mgnify:CR=1 FL=1
MDEMTVRAALEAVLKYGSIDKKAVLCAHIKHRSKEYVLVENYTPIQAKKFWAALEFVPEFSELSGNVWLTHNRWLHHTWDSDGLEHWELHEPPAVPDVCRPDDPDVSDAKWRSDALAEYVKHKMTPKQFAAHVGVTQTQAYNILRGQSWRDIGRPDGFKFPWKPQKTHRQICTERTEIYREGVRLWAENGWTFRQLAEHMGVPAYTAWTAVQREYKAVGKAEVDAVVRWLRLLATNEPQAEVFADLIERGEYKDA